MKKEDDIPRYISIICGPVILSIQAGPYYYSNPKRAVDLKEYSEMEVAIFDIDYRWINLHKFSPLNTYPRRDELLYYYEGAEEDPMDVTSVLPYVPVDLIQDLFRWLKQKYN